MASSRSFVCTCSARMGRGGDPRQSMRRDGHWSTLLGDHHRPHDRRCAVPLLCRRRAQAKKALRGPFPMTTCTQSGRRGLMRPDHFVERASHHGGFEALAVAGGQRARAPDAVNVEEPATGSADMQRLKSRMKKAAGRNTAAPDADCQERLERSAARERCGRLSPPHPFPICKTRHNRPRPVRSRPFPRQPTTAGLKKSSNQHSQNLVCGKSATSSRQMSLPVFLSVFPRTEREKPSFHAPSDRRFDPLRGPTKFLI